MAASPSLTLSDDERAQVLLKLADGGATARPPRPSMCA